MELLSSDISDWRITFADTGFETPMSERLRRVRDYLGNDGVFLANYGDVLTNAPMNDLIDDFMQTDAVGSLLAVPPRTPSMWCKSTATAASLASSLWPT